MKFRGTISNNKGFTLIELMVTIVLIGMVLGLASLFFNISFLSEKKVENEYMLQANMRQASEALNTAIRNASVTFTLTEDVFDGSAGALKKKWNYFGLKNDGKEIVQYIYNSTTDNHDEKVIVSEREGITYNLYFTQNNPGTKMIQFNIECIPDGDTSKKISIETELEALNSVAVDDGGSAENPAVAIAYRSDPSPNPEVITTQSEVTIAISLVLDDSGSMDWDMAGHKPGEWGFNSSNVRKTIMKARAQKLIEQFAALSTSGGIQVSVIPFADDADRASAMYNCYAYKSQLKTIISGLGAVGGTNTGDGLRRAYFQLANYNTSNPKKEIVNYIILLTDGNPTYRSSTNSWTYTPQKTDGNSLYLDGSGGETTTNIDQCMTYVNTIGQELVVGKTINIKTFVIGFSAVPTNITNAREIAEVCCTKTGSTTRTGTYYEAASDIALENVFNSITTTILAETWHIYGPY